MNKVLHLLQICQQEMYLIVENIYRIWRVSVEDGGKEKNKKELKRVTHNQDFLRLDWILFGEWILLGVN